MALQVKYGTQLGQAAYLPGQPGGAGGPGGPAAPNVGAGWEVKVLLAPSYSMLLAVIPAKMLMGLQFVKQLKDTGSGTVTLDMDDKFWTSVTLPNGQPAHYLLDYEHVWQIFQDGVPRFEFLGETVTEQLADNSEQRIVTIAGPGVIAALKWAMVAPPGFPGSITYKLDALQDGFNEVDGSGNLVINYGLWNACANTSRISVNPSGSARLTGSPSGTIMGTTAYDATSTLVSAQVSPIVSPDANGVTLNGSQVTQMYVQSLANSGYYALLGLSATVFYAQLTGPAGTFTHTIATAAAFNAAAQGTNNYAYWQISEQNGTFFFWTSTDGQNWAQQWQVDHHWDATQVGLYFLAQYSVDNAEFATVTGINTNVTTSSLGGPLYFSKPVIGGVWLDLLNKAKARGTVPFITTGAMSASTDSFGNPWTDSQSVQIQNGTDMLALLGAHASMINADWIMQPGFRLQVGIPTTGAITLGFDRSNQVIFRDGEDCTAKTRVRARNTIANLLGVINADSRTITASDSTSESLWGQREGWLQAAMQVSQADMQVVATAADLQNASEVLSYTLQVSPFRPGRTVFTGYDAGDWVGLERPDFSAVDKVRVVAIAVQVDSTGAETHELTLSTYIQWLSQQLTYIATKMGGGFVSAAGTTAIAGNGQLTNLNAPTIASPTLPGLAGVLAGGPGTNTPLVYDPNTGNWVPAGTVNPDTGAVSNVVLSGTGGTTTIAGSGGSVTVANTPVPPADGGGAAPTPASQVIGVFSTTITDATGTTRQVIGAQSDGTVTSKDFNGAAPGAPDTPAVTGTLNGILVTWDGLIAASAPLSDFLWCEVHVSVSSGFTPSSATLQGTLVSAAVFPVSGLTVGVTYYARLMARNTSGAAGTPSVQASAVPSALTASLVGQLGVLNANPYFSGGDASTWAAVNGTFSVTASPPAGTPDPYAGLYTQVGSTAGSAQENGQPFRVAINTQYLVTAWVYTPTTSAIIGFDWLNSSHVYISTSTQTFTVTANTWTLVTTVQTSPGTAVWAYPRVAPAAGSGNTIYIEAVLCLPQVPGSLVQAGTITATQIAANTITAAQIAANTITASQILGNTITAAQIAANTITASQIATGTITAGLLAAGIVKAGIVDGTSISAATFIAYGTSGEVLVYSGTPASGNLIGSWSGQAGSDGLGNSFPAGLNVTTGAISGTAITGGTITGANIIADGSSGEFLIYAGTPASGNLIGSWSAVATADGFSNTIPSGLSVVGSVLNLGNTSLPSPITGTTQVFSDYHGMTRALSGLAGDTDYYVLGHKAGLATGTTSITAVWTSSQAINGMSLNVGVGNYRIHGLVQGISGSGSGIALGIIFTGSCAVSTMLVNVKMTNHGASSTTANGDITALNAGSSNPRLPGSGETFDIVFDGFFDVSTAGTFVVNGYNFSGQTWTAQANSYVGLWPWV